MFFNRVSNPHPIMYVATIYPWKTFFRWANWYIGMQKVASMQKNSSQHKKVSFSALLLQNWYLTKKTLSAWSHNNKLFSMKAIASDHQTLLCYDEVFHCCSEHWMCFLWPRQQNLWNTGIVNSQLHHSRMIKTNLWLNGYHLLSG